MKSKKIILVFLVAAMIIFSSMGFVYADSLSVNMAPDRQNYAPGQTVEITVSLDNISSDAGIYGVTGKLNYSTDIFEPIIATDNGATTDITSLNGWGAVSYNKTSNEFTILTTSPAKAKQSIMKIKLKIKEGATLGKATIMLDSLQASNSTEDIDTSPVSISINVKEAGDIDPIDPIVSPSPEASPIPVTSPSPATVVSPKASPVASPVVVKTTPASGKIPQTGIEDTPIVPIVAGALIVSLISFVAYRRYKDI